MSYRRFVVIVAVVAVCGVSQAADKLQIQLEKGGKLAYRVETENATKYEFGERSGESTSERATGYAVTVKDVTDTGTVLEVKYTSLKIQRAGGRGDFAFDSKKKGDGEDPQAAFLRQVLAATITVTVDGEGKVTKVEGFPEMARPERPEGEGGDRRGGRGFRGPRGPIGEYSLRADLDVILGAGLQGKDLVAGETYRIGSRSPRQGGPQGRGGFGGGRGGRGGEGDTPRRRRRPGDDESLAPLAPQDNGQDRPRGRGQDRVGRGQDRPGSGQGRGGQGRGGQGRGGQDRRGGFSGFFGGFGYGLKFTAAGKAKGLDVMQFDLMSRPRPAFGGGEPEEPKAVGKASYGKADGLLERLEVRTDDSRSSDRGSFSRKSRTLYERVRAGTKPKKEGKKAKKAKKATF